MEQRAQGEYRAFGQLGHRRDDRRARLYRAARRSRSAKLSRHRDLAGPQPDRGTQRRLRPVALRRQRRAAPDSGQGCFDRRSRSMTAHPPLRTPMRLRAPRGFTLIELMVGITLGLIVLAVVTLAFVNVSSNRRDMERTGRQIENGRFAAQLLADDIVNAGYFGEFDPRVVGPPTAKPDPCSTSVADMKSMALMHVQGYAAGAAMPSCISDVRTGTAVVAIRRIATCIAGDTNCDTAATDQIYFQSALCNAELANVPLSTTYL